MASQSTEVPCVTSELNGPPMDVSIDAIFVLSGHYMELLVTLPAWLLSPSACSTPADLNCCPARPLGIKTRLRLPSSSSTTHLCPLCHPYCCHPRIQAPCCKLSFTQKFALQCAHPWNTTPHFPKGDPLRGGPWKWTYPDPGTYDGNECAEDDTKCTL